MPTISASTCSMAKDTYIDRYTHTSISCYMNRVKNVKDCEIPMGVLH